MEKEIWITLESGYHAVSNFGRIKKLPLTVIQKSGKVLRQPECILIPCLTEFGYLNIVHEVNGKRISIRAHRLIAMAFIPNPENKPDINHKNGIKTDNRIENLEWCTPKENMIHAYKNGLVKSHRKAFSDEEKNKIKTLKDSGLTFAAISKIMNVNVSSVGRNYRKQIGDTI